MLQQYNRDRIEPSWAAREAVSEAACGPDASDALDERAAWPAGTGPAATWSPAVDEAVGRAGGSPAGKETRKDDRMTDENTELASMFELVIVSGMSGAGRTEAMHSFEDLGYFCVDNLPSSLIGSLLELTQHAGPARRAPPPGRGATRATATSFANLTAELAKLMAQGIGYRILFLDAADEKSSRHKSSRRRHPLCADGASIAQGIDRRFPVRVREVAHHVVDTTDMLPAQLRATIRALFAPGSEQQDWP